MIAESGREIKITKMSLAVAKDSGWYEVDLSLGENYFWGKGDGCDIFLGNCSHVTVSELCPSIYEIACSDNHVERTICIASTFNLFCGVDIFGESCKVFKEVDDDEFYYGKESVCLKREVS